MAAKLRMTGMRMLFYALAAVGVVGICSWLAWQNARRAERRQEQATTARAEGQPGGVPERLLGGLILLSPEQLVSAPTVDGFQWPCGAPNAAMIYDAQPFGAMNERRGGKHTGQDLNGIGGADSDQGLPVYAAGRGLVVYSGVPSDEWGNVIILAHRLPGQAGVVQTLYAHLEKRSARVGRIVARGECIGTVGTADGKYLAHLHFEAIPSYCTEAGMPGYHPAGTMNRIDPSELLRRYPAPECEDTLGAVRQLRAREAAEQQKSKTPPPAPQEPGYVPVSPHQFL